MGKNSVFKDKDKEKVSPGYVPKKLVGRTEEIRTLARWFRPVLDGNVDQRATVLGPRGSEKTALSLVFCRDLEAFAEKRGDDLTRLYVPRRGKRSSWRVLGDLRHRRCPQRLLL